MRAPCLTLLLLIAAAAPAGATAQTPENILINGRVTTMRNTPLAPLLELRKDLEDVFASLSSGCWRGYVGTWCVEGDRLYLVKLVREELRDDPEDERAGRSVYVDVEVPLSTLFSSDEGPVAATWYSGTLRTPLSIGYRYVHMGFATTQDRELHLEVVRGRVVGKRIVNLRAANRGRCEQDLSWVALAETAHTGRVVHDDGTWVDARAIAGPEFGEGAAVITRGVLERVGDEVFLQVPETLVTPPVSHRLANAPTWPADRTWPHVELEAVWDAGEAPAALCVRWFRLLAYGETIHHPAFPLPELPPELETDPEQRLGPDGGCPVFSRRDVESVFGAEPAVSLRGALEAGRPNQVHGVDVAPAPELAGKAVRASGALEKWIVTKRLLATGHPDLEPFRARGPGTYYRLVHPETGELVRPVAAPEDDRK